MSSSTPQAGSPVEVVPAVIDATTRRGADAFPVAVAAAVLPTQMRHPWRSVLRGAWQNFIGLCVLLPILVSVAGVDADQLPWLAVPLAAAAFVTRAMSDPRVEAVLRRIPIAQLFAAAPAPPE